MTIADAIYQHSLRLPEHAAREALDFIEFLERRYAAAGTASSLEPLEESARRDALARLDDVRIAWDGKPIPDRNALYDETRGG
jgi:hypothetical protein